jgi:TolA-binding protein
MKKLAFALALFPAVALAQPMPPAPPSQQPDAQTQALSQSVIDLTGQNVQLRAQIISLQHQLSQAQAKPPAPPAAPTPTPTPAPTPEPPK